MRTDNSQTADCQKTWASCSAASTAADRFVRSRSLKIVFLTRTAILRSYCRLPVQLSVKRFKPSYQDDTFHAQKSLIVPNVDLKQEPL